MGEAFSPATTRSQVNALHAHHASANQISFNMARSLEGDYG
jgi:hypothetical protein